MNTLIEQRRRPGGGVVRRTVRVDRQSVPFCGWAFDCGCDWPWRGLAAHCNYFALWVALHWLSSAATSFARGLNDVPKIAALLIVALAARSTDGAGGATGFAVIVLVTLTMGLGSLWGGFRVAEVLAHRVTQMDRLVANVGTSLLVLAASPLGLPVSTTHVSTGALMGIRWAESERPAQSDALRAIFRSPRVSPPSPYSYPNCSKVDYAQRPTAA